MNNNIPTIIEQYILKMSDKATPLHIRNNYKFTLENISNVITKEVDKFNKEYLLKMSKTK